MRAAAVDIGTNSMRLLVADRRAGEVEWVDRRATVTGLGAGLERTGRLDEERMRSTLVALTSYGEAMDAAGVGRRRAVATSATRDAENRELFLDRAQVALGVRPEVISGDVEAELAFTGATAGLEGRVLVIDTGGGSTELVLGEGTPMFRASVEMGAVRLTDRDFDARPAGLDQIERARVLAAGAFAGIVLPDRQPDLVVGVAGTFTSLAAIDQDLPVYDPARVHGHRLSRGRLTELVLYLAGLDLAETAAIPSLDPARAPVILAGAIVAEAALAVVAAEEVMVSERDLLDGIILELTGPG